MNWKEVAILCRTRSDFERFEVGLARARIPHQTVGGLSFFDRREVKDIMAILAWLLNPRASHNLVRFCKSFVKGLGESAFDKIYEMAGDNPTLYTLSQANGKNKPTKKTFCIAETLARLLLAGNQQNSAEATLKELDKQFGLYGLLKASSNDPKDKTAHQREESLAQLIDLAKQIGGNLQVFVDHIALLGSADEDESDNKVVLSTIHAAKGREFSIVIVPALYEGRLPHFRAETEEDIAQELNCYYVAKTRAKEILIMTRPCATRSYGSPTLTPNKRSRFVQANLKKLQEVGTVKLLGQPGVQPSKSQ